MLLNKNSNALLSRTDVTAVKKSFEGLKARWALGWTTQQSSKHVIWTGNNTLHDRNIESPAAPDLK